MIRVSAYYPAKADCTFDHDYYAGTHRTLVQERLASFGLKKVEMDRGLAGFGGGPAPYVAVGYLCFDSLDDFQKGWETHGEEIFADIPRFTNITPVVQISEVTAG